MVSSQPPQFGRDSKGLAAMLAARGQPGKKLEKTARSRIKWILKVENLQGAPCFASAKAG